MFFMNEAWLLLASKTWPKGHIPTPADMGVFALTAARELFA